eukprot:3407390-Pleurochrysis_carterae.AAC.1
MLASRSESRSPHSGACLAVAPDRPLARAHKVALVRVVPDERRAHEDRNLRWQSDNIVRRKASCNQRTTGSSRQHAI